MTLKIVFIAGVVSLAALAQSDLSIPSGPLKFGSLSARFASDGAFTVEGPGWPSYKGSWRRQGAEIEVVTTGDPAAGCDQPGRYRVAVDNTRLSLAMVADPCVVRRALLDRSAW